MEGKMRGKQDEEGEKKEDGGVRRRRWRDVEAVCQARAGLLAA